MDITLEGMTSSNLTPTARDYHDQGVDAPDWSLAAAMLEPVAWTGRRGEGNAQTPPRAARYSSRSTVRS